LTVCQGLACVDFAISRAMCLGICYICPCLHVRACKISDRSTPHRLNRWHNPAASMAAAVNV